jgi:predicted nucleic acid-binding protein
VNVEDALRGVTRLFLDSSPVIYYAESHPQYLPLTRYILEQVRVGDLDAVTSPITLAECLVMPFRLAAPTGRQVFVNLITRGTNTFFARIGENEAVRAAELRSRYNLGLPDALQIAVAIENGCEALLTNDFAFRRVSELRILVLDDLEL